MVKLLKRITKRTIKHQLQIYLYRNTANWLYIFDGVNTIFDSYLPITDVNPPLSQKMYSNPDFR